MGGASFTTSSGRDAGRGVVEMTADIPAFANDRATFDPSAPAAMIPRMVSIAISPLLADAVLSAVDDDCLAGDECRVVARQEQDGAGDVRGLTEPLDRLVFPGGALLRFRLRRGCGVGGPAGQYPVFGNASASHVLRPPPPQSPDPHLRSDV